MTGHSPMIVAVSGIEKPAGRSSGCIAWRMPPRFGVWPEAGLSASTTRTRRVSVRNYGDPIGADPPGGWGGGGLGKPARTVWPPARLSGAGTPGPPYDDGFPKAPP